MKEQFHNTKRRIDGSKKRKEKFQAVGHLFPLNLSVTISITITHMYDI